MSNQELTRILVLAANPRGMESLRLDQELREIQDGLERAGATFTVRPRLATRPNDLSREILQFKPQLVHFCGHGLEEGILLEDESGEPKLVAPDALASLFELFTEHVQCVVLNCCSSAPQAQAISRHIPFVIGTNHQISDHASLTFSAAFYEAIGAGREVRFAFRYGRSRIKLEGIPEDWIPQIFSDGRVDPSESSRLDEVLDEPLKQSEPAFALPPLPPVYFRDPFATAAGFMGRSREKEILSAWLTDPNPVLIWAALGGQGKTSLVSNWFQGEPGLRQGWEGVIWWSFYAPASLPDELARFALDSIAGGFPEESPRRRFDQLLKEFRGRRFLVILDGFERALTGYTGANAVGATALDVALGAEERSVADADFDWFLRMIVSTPQFASKVLITTRDVPFSLEDVKGCVVQRLDVLSVPEATDYLRSAGVFGEPYEFEEAFAEYGRHPLGLKLLKGLIVEDLKTPRDLKVLRRLELPTELKDRERRHHVLEHAYRVMPEAARGLLERLSLYRAVIDYPKLQVFEEQFPLQIAVKDLIARGFVERDEQTYDMHPVVRQFARTHFLTTDPKGATSAHHLIADLYRRQTGEELLDEFLPMPPQDERYVGPRRLDADRIRSIDDITPTLELIYHLMMGGDLDRAIVTLRNRLAHLLVYKFSAFRILKDLLDPVLLGRETASVAPMPPANDKHAWALNVLANCYRVCASVCRAAVLHEVVVRWDEQQGNNNIFAIRLVNLAIDQQLIGDFQEAERNLLRCLEIARRSYGSNLVSCLRELGRLYTWLEKFSDAEASLTEALELAPELEPYYWRVLVNHSHLLLAQKEPSRALKQAREAERVSRELQVQSLLEAKHAVALCLMATGTPKNREEAGYVLREALEEAGEDGLATLHVQLLLALAQWSGPGPEAKDLAKRALRIAVDGDYVPFESDAHSCLGEIALANGSLGVAQTHGDLALKLSLQRKDPRTRDYLAIPAGSSFRYELGHRRATELLKRIDEAGM